MIVSWNWLKEYVLLDMPVAELETRLMMAGLNHEGTADVNGDFAIDLEVTSNRPDCLGHIGVAREVAVLFDRALTIPAAAPAESSTPAAELTSVAVECPKLCPRYTARVVRGAKIGPSPKWLVRRLETLGIDPINNVVDITNYVLFESGQPLHAFDLAKLHEQRIVVRESRPGEPFEAINHKTYTLEPGMCVIADAERPVALGGVMGGADTEVSDQTTELLIEAADFAPVSIRGTARKLNLHSDSSYRFERGVDPAGIDWASRRACELILELAGGELAAGLVDVSQPVQPREPVVLRFDQLVRILGIDVPGDEARRILAALGNTETAHDDKQVEVVPPSWRRDLVREADLVEEVARIYGYDAIPEDVSVPMVPSHRSDEDRVLERTRNALVGCGFYEAVTTSAVTAKLAEVASPWSEADSLVTATPVLRGADQLRRSLLPSLLAARRTNETLSNARIELFEIAKVYLPQPSGLPAEERMLALSSGKSFVEVKGVVEALLGALGIRTPLEVADCESAPFQAGAGCRLLLAGQTLGYLGPVSEAARAALNLQNETVVAELNISQLLQQANLVSKYEAVPDHPAITRDLNLEVDDAVRWADVASTVRAARTKFLEGMNYKETYRDEQLTAAGKKRLLLTITLRSPQATLTGGQADADRDAIVAACEEKLGARLPA